MLIRPAFFLHGLFWTILCGAFVFVGVEKTWPVIATGRVRPVRPFDSTDRYLEWFFQSDQGSLRILGALEGTPRDKPIALVLPDAEKESAFVYQIITYLAWPREVQWVLLKRETAVSQLKSLNQESLAAIVFWGVAPPDWLPGAIQIGPRQTILPFSPAKEAHP